MMTKLVVPGAQDFGAGVARLVKVAADGRFGANDLAAFVKRAGHEFVDHLRRHPLAPGEVPIHLIAIGATEFYGPNRNGDGFKEACLKKYTHTFVTKPVTREGAYFYRDHNNKNPLKSYGTVKAAFYNPVMHRSELLVALNGTQEAADRNHGLLADRELEKLARDDDGDVFGVSMACRVPFDVCFTAGTLVETSAGLRPIESVSAGDTVRTHRGRWRKVLEDMRRPYSGVMVEMEVLGLPAPVRATAGHPFWVVRQEEFRACRGTARGRKRRHTLRSGGSSCVTCRSEVTVRPKWRDARDVRVGDYLVYPVREPGKVEVRRELAYLLGLYAGDGSVICRRAGRRRDGEPVRQGISVTLDNKHPDLIAHVLETAEALHGRRQKANPAGEGRDAVQVHVYSRELAATAEALVGRGYDRKAVAGEVYEWSREARLQFLAGCLDSDGSVDLGCRYGSGRFVVCNRQLADDVQKLWWGLGVPAGLHDQVVEIGYAPGSIAYTVSIPQWAVAMLAGCSIKARGVVGPTKQHQKAFLLDGLMHVPVQRIVQETDETEVFNLHVEEDETYLVGVVAHNCSGCGNRARHRGEYCTGRTCRYGGLADSITKVAGDGHVLHADNPDPTFFDISHVYRPADRTAYVMGMLKAAGGVVLGGAELAERAGVSEPVQARFSSAAAAAQAKIARALADAEAVVAAAPQAFEVRAFHPTLSPATGAETMAKTAAARGAAVRALADRQVLLPVRDFLALEAGEPVEKVAALSARVSVRLPGVFGRLLADQGAEEVFAASPYLTDAPAGLAARLWATKCAAHSLDRRSVTDRATVALLRELPEPTAPRPVVADEPAEKLARQYALYQLGFLRHWAETVEAPRLSDLVVRRNYAGW